MVIQAGHGTATAVAALFDRRFQVLVERRAGGDQNQEVYIRRTHEKEVWNPC
jgi:hypothetical protein